MADIHYPGNSLVVPDPACLGLTADEIDTEPAPIYDEMMEQYAVLMGGSK